MTTRKRNLPAAKPDTNMSAVMPPRSIQNHWPPQASAGDTENIFRLGPFLPHLARQTARMKLNLLAWRKRDEGETLAQFGEARLIKRLTGKIELIGGSADDRTAAREYVSLFLHEAAI